MANPLDTLKKAKLKDMHVKPKSPEVTEAKYQAEEKKPRIPYGLKISLDEESLKNLGMTTKDFSIEGKMLLMAECEVCEISSSKSEDYENENVRMKIVNMALVPKGSS